MGQRSATHQLAGACGIPGATGRSRPVCWVHVTAKRLPTAATNSPCQPERQVLKLPVLPSAPQGAATYQPGATPQERGSGPFPEALKGRDTSGRKWPSLCPYRASSIGLRRPRAMPWADMWCPSGRTGDVNEPQARALVEEPLLPLRVGMDRVRSQPKPAVGGSFKALVGTTMATQKLDQYQAITSYPVMIYRIPTKRLTGGKGRVPRTRAGGEPVAPGNP